jgi:hypothetical protein
MNVFYYLTVDTILISRTRIILYTNEALTYARVGGDFTSYYSTLFVNWRPMLVIVSLQEVKI